MDIDLDQPLRERIKKFLIGNDGCIESVAKLNRADSLCIGAIINPEMDIQQRKRTRMRRILQSQIACDINAEPLVEVRSNSQLDTVNHANKRNRQCKQMEDTRLPTATRMKRSKVACTSAQPTANIDVLLSMPVGCTSETNSHIDLLPNADCFTLISKPEESISSQNVLVRDSDSACTLSVVSDTIHDSISKLEETEQKVEFIVKECQRFTTLRTVSLCDSTDSHMKELEQCIQVVETLREPYALGSCEVPMVSSGQCDSLCLSACCLSLTSPDASSNTSSDSDASLTPVDSPDSTVPSPDLPDLDPCEDCSNRESTADTKTKVAAKKKTMKSSHDTSGAYRVRPGTRRAASMEAAAGKDHEKELEDIYRNRLWKKQMPHDRSWETIYEEPLRVAKNAGVKVQSIARQRRQLIFCDNVPPMKTRRRQQRARKYGWLPFDKQRLLDADTVLQHKLTTLDSELETLLDCSTLQPVL